MSSLLRLTTWKGPGKCHDDVTEIVRVSHQAPPARGQESLTSWGKDGFLICSKKITQSITWHSVNWSSHQRLHPKDFPLTRQAIWVVMVIVRYIYLHVNRSIKTGLQNFQVESQISYEQTYTLVTWVPAVFVLLRWQDMFGWPLAEATRKSLKCWAFIAVMSCHVVLANYATLYHVFGFSIIYYAVTLKFFRVRIASESVLLRVCSPEYGITNDCKETEESIRWNRPWYMCVHMIMSQKTI